MTAEDRDSSASVGISNGSMMRLVLCKYWENCKLLRAVPIGRNCLLLPGLLRWCRLFLLSLFLPHAFFSCLILLPYTHMGSDQQGPTDKVAMCFAEYQQQNRAWKGRCGANRSLITGNASSSSQADCDIPETIVAKYFCMPKTFNRFNINISSPLPYLT